MYPEGSFMVIPLNGEPIRFMTYQEYIISPEWRERVSTFKDAQGWTCEQCGSTRDITGHHKHYLNLGNELPEDIEILCWPCHKSKH